MTTTVKQLIEMLQTLPEEAEVEVVHFVEGQSYQGGYGEFCPLNLTPEFPGLGGFSSMESENFEVLDLRENQFVKEERNKKVYVRLGYTE